MAVVKITQILVILLIKFIYSIYRLIYRPKDLLVRNSPLNLLATHLSKIILVAKISCIVTVSLSGPVRGNHTCITPFTGPLSESRIYC